MIINKEVPSKYRATTLSTSALLGRVPYVFVAIAAGEAAEAGLLGVFALAVGSVLILATVINFFYFRVFHREKSASL